MLIIACCFANDANRKTLNYPGIGIAMVALIDNTVSVTTRQSDNVPTASDARWRWSIGRKQLVRGGWKAPMPGTVSWS